MLLKQLVTVFIYLFIYLFLLWLNKLEVTNTHSVNIFGCWFNNYIFALMSIYGSRRVYGLFFLPEAAN